MTQLDLAKKAYASKRGAEFSEDHTIQILRLPDVERASGLKRSQIYEMIAAGNFPAQVKLGARASGWVAHEIEAWIRERIAERDAARANQAA